MVTAPTLYGVTLAAIVFCGFSMAAIGRARYSPQAQAQPTVDLVFPEPFQPTGLLSAGEDLPLPVTSSIVSAHLSAPPVLVDDAPPATLSVSTQAMLAGLLAAAEPQPATPEIARLAAATVSPENASPLYRPVLMDGVTRLIQPASTTIPSPWEPESDRYWNQNNTITYPNSVPMLAGSAP